MLGDIRRDLVNRRRLSVFAFLVMFGIFALLNGLNNPRLSGVHGSDIVKLVASGVCFGMGFGLLLVGRKFKGE